MSERTCRQCGESRPLERFRFHAGYHRRICRECENSVMRDKWARDEDGRKAKQLARYRKFKYGVDAAALTSLFEHQGGVCALCAKDLGSDPSKFHVDHDHRNGEARGLLCHRCNRAIGFFEDDIENFYRAIRYLQDPPMRRLARKKA